MDKKEYQREYIRIKHEEAKPAYNALMKYYPFTLDDLDGEIWKDIAGFEGYQVSTFGRVKSFKYKSPLILKPALKRQYLSVDLSIDGEKKQRYVHVLVAQAFIPNPDNKPEVNHDDGNKFNCYAGNLYWATRAENMRHAIRTGLQVNPQGEEHHNAKLKNADAVYIRDNPDNLSAKQLAEKFDLTTAEVRFIQRGKTYENAGGTIREPHKKPVNRTPDEIREQIRADWATGLYTKAALARKYGYNRTTIRNIINEVTPFSTAAN